MNAHEVLVEARNLLDKGEWVQHNACERNRACAAGAVCRITIDHDDASDVVALEALVQSIGTSAIGEWNDAPGRTKDDVLAAFDRAISATAPEPADPGLPAGVEQLA